MTDDTFRDILRRQPFEPFRIVMSSGENYHVLHPEMAFITAKALILTMPEPETSAGERLALCSYLHVAHVENAQNYTGGIVIMIPKTPITPPSTR